MNDDKCIRPGITLLTGVLLLLASFASVAQTTQQRIHHRSHLVMPFDMSKTLHIFRMTETGGVEKVIARDPGDSVQIRLIRQHLEHEAGKFQHGDYSDPARLHGADMPGLHELHANAARIRVTYRQLPNGAQITFHTRDLASLTAIHRWFGAQLSQHGADAKAE
jgi:hypothetical protein